MSLTLEYNPKNTISHYSNIRDLPMSLQNLHWRKPISQYRDLYVQYLDLNMFEAAACDVIYDK
jgi:hypothetical protein